MSLLRNVEAVLFAVGKKLSVEEIGKLCRTEHIDDVKAALYELKGEYERRDSSVRVSDDDGWKLAVKDDYLSLVQGLIQETELTKSVMETLAVIAWKYPCLQSDVVHIRTNKAYDHLMELEEKGFIERSDYGRTRKIRLTQKFFTYFDLPSKEQAQRVFKGILPEEIQRKIEQTEQEIVETEQAIEQSKKKEELPSEQTTLS